METIKKILKTIGAIIATIFLGITAIFLFDKHKDKKEELNNAEKAREDKKNELEEDRHICRRERNRPLLSRNNIRPGKWKRHYTRKLNSDYHAVEQQQHNNKHRQDWRWCDRNSFRGEYIK